MQITLVPTAPRRNAHSFMVWRRAPVALSAVVVLVATLVLSIVLILQHLAAPDVLAQPALHLLTSSHSGTGTITDTPMPGHLVYGAAQMTIGG